MKLVEIPDGIDIVFRIQRFRDKHGNTIYKIRGDGARRKYYNLSSVNAAAAKFLTEICGHMDYAMYLNVHTISWYEHIATGRIVE